MSGLSRPPRFVKNFRPFLLKGKWLAVSITEPSYWHFSNTVLINMAGVEAIPQSTAEAPADTIPCIKAFINEGPDILESLPTETVNFSGGKPFRSDNHKTNETAIVSTIAGVRFTICPW